MEIQQSMLRSYPTFADSDLLFSVIFQPHGILRQLTTWPCQSAPIAFYADDRGLWRSEVRWSDSCNGQMMRVTLWLHMRRIAASSARIVLVAITLFVLGPQFGALDTDGDGVPDVPLMVVDPRNDQEAKLQRSDRKTKIDLATASPLFRLISDYLQFLKARIVLDPPASRLYPVVPLRC